MIISPEPTGVTMGQTHDDWHEWRHRTDEQLNEHEQRLRQLDDAIAEISKQLTLIERDIRWGGGLILLLLAAQIGANAVR